ncbi:MAG: YidC/Oxa1 family membrane protein insertase [Candidatus Sericytochromatia bacterium]
MNPIDFLVHQMMLPILEKAHTITGSYGWAIIFLTVIIRMVLLPLTMQSYYSMKEMQKLQPKLKKIQERYRNKPEELNKQMVQLYKEHKVNPLGGCLPLLIQMPFLFALYAALNGKEFQALVAANAAEKAFLFMPDLTRVGLYAKDVIFWENGVLLALFTITTILQQRVMTPTQGPDADPRQVAMQKQMAIMMPIMITVMFLIIPVPTGIYLYLVVSNLIGIAQYLFLNAHSKRREALRAEAMSEAPVVSKAQEANARETAAVVSAPPTYGAADDKYRVKKGAKKKKKRK